MISPGRHARRCSQSLLRARVPVRLAPRRRVLRRRRTGPLRCWGGWGPYRLSHTRTNRCAYQRRTGRGGSWSRPSGIARGWGPSPPHAPGLGRTSGARRVGPLRLIRGSGYHRGAPTRGPGQHRVAHHRAGGCRAAVRSRPLLPRAGGTKHRSRHLLPGVLTDRSLALLARRRAGRRAAEVRCCATCS
jgi:hypothetical protein